MNTMLAGTGIACVIGAVVGGGLKGFGLEIPLLQSIRRQALLAFIGIVLLAASVAPDFTGLFPHSDAGQNAAEPVTNQPESVATSNGHEDAANAVQTPPAKQPAQPVVKPPAAAVAASLPQLPNIPPAAGDDPDVAALTSQFEGLNNRMKVAIAHGQTPDCEVSLKRMDSVQANLAGHLIGYGVQYVPDFRKSPPPPDPCLGVGP
jgi:hypothetical protein